MGREAGPCRHSSGCFTVIYSGRSVASSFLQAKAFWINLVSYRAQSNAGRIENVVLVLWPRLFFALWEFLCCALAEAVSAVIKGFCS